VVGDWFQEVSDNYGAGKIMQREKNKRRNWAIVGINDMNNLRDKLMEFSK
jgi:hypothetical protein